MKRAIEKALLYRGERGKESVVAIIDFEMPLQKISPFSWHKACLSSIGTPKIYDLQLGLASDSENFKGKLCCCFGYGMSLSV